MFDLPFFQLFILVVVLWNRSSSRVCILVVTTIVFIPADLRRAVRHSKLLKASEAFRLGLVMDHHLLNVTACEENQVVRLIILFYVMKLV